MIRTSAMLAMAMLAACDAQVDAHYAGPPLVRLRATAAGFGPDDVVDAAALRWNPQVGADLAAGPVSATPLESAPPASFAILVLRPPPGEAYFAFADAPAQLAEARLLLTRGGAVVGEAIDHVLVHVDGDVAEGSLAADYLGGALPAGFHLRDTRATAELTAAQAVLAARCGGGDACRRPRLYRLVSAPDGLATELVFFPHRSAP